MESLKNLILKTVQGPISKLWIINIRLIIGM